MSSFLVLAIGVLPAVANAGIIAHWKLDDGQSDNTTTTAVDEISPASHGTLVNFPSPPTSKWTTGISGGALLFGENGAGTASNGGPDADDVVAIANPSAGKLDLNGAMSISTWVLLDEDGGRNSTRHIAGIDASGGAAGDAYSLKHNGSGGDVGKVAFLIAQASFGPAFGDNNLTSTQTLNVYKAASVTAGNGGWVHLVGVFDPGNSMKLYVNGVLDNEETTVVPTAIDSVATPFHIGRLAGTSVDHSFHGGIDDVQVYNMALSASDVSYLYNNPGTAVPEPSSVLLGALCLFGLTMTSRFRRK